MQLSLLHYRREICFSNTSLYAYLIIFILFVDSLNSDTDQWYTGGFFADIAMPVSVKWQTPPVNSHNHTHVYAWVNLCCAEMPNSILYKSVTPPENAHPFLIMEEGIIDRYRSQIYI
jgi:hypothetical protein